MKMLNAKNIGIVQKKSVKSVGVAIQLTDEEIIEFDKMYSLFDVNLQGK
jgi:hypothetical protein